MKRISLTLRGKKRLFHNVVSLSQTNIRFPNKPSHTSIIPFGFMTRKSGFVNLTSNSDLPSSNSDTTNLTSKPSTRVKDFSPDQYELCYRAQFAREVRTLKLVSLTSCVGTSVGAPLSLWLSTHHGLVARLFIATTVLITGVGTTALWTFITRGYVVRAYLSKDPKERQEGVWLQTLTIFGRPRTEYVRRDDLVPFNNFLNNFYSKSLKRQYLLHEGLLQGDIKAFFPSPPREKGKTETLSSTKE